MTSKLLANIRSLSVAVCTVTHNTFGQLLIVARKENPNDWNLPGGKVECQESMHEAARRELFEETGLILDVDDFQLVFFDLTDDHKAVCLSLITRTAHGDLNPQPGEAMARWGTWEDILTERSSYYEYNQKLYNRLKAEKLLP